MKKATLCLVIGLAGALLFCSETSASLFPEGRSAAVRPTQQDNAVSTFWERFKAAVIAGDKAKVATLSRFPIERGYGMADVRNRAQFVKRYRELFFNETNAAQCFPKAKPVVDRERPNEFSVSCPFARDSSGGEPFVYTFTRTRTGWKFISFQNINE